MKVRLKGLEKTSRFPNIIICFEKTLNEFILHEAFILRLPIICLINSSEKCLNITFPIYGNTNSFESFSFYLNILMSSIKKGFIKRRLSFLTIKYVLNSSSIISNPENIAKILNNFAFYSNDYAKFRLKRSVRRIYYYNNLWKIQHRKKTINKKKSIRRVNEIKNIKARIIKKLKFKS